MPTLVTTVAIVIAWAIAIGIIAIGIRILLTAPKAAEDFGIPSPPTGDPAFRSWLSVKADRDIGSGLLLLVALLAGSIHLQGWMMLAGAVMPFADALIVRRSGGPAWAYAGVHGGTAAVMAIAGAVLLLS